MPCPPPRIIDVAPAAELKRCPKCRKARCPCEACQKRAENTGLCTKCFQTQKEALNRGK
jgi:hypothetical protein